MKVGKWVFLGGTVTVCGSMSDKLREDYNPPSGQMTYHPRGLIMYHRSDKMIKIAEQYNSLP